MLLLFKGSLECEVWNCCVSAELSSCRNLFTGLRPRLKHSRINSAKTPNLNFELYLSNNTMRNDKKHHILFILYCNIIPKFCLLMQRLKLFDAFLLTNNPACSWREVVFQQDDKREDLRPAFAIFFKVFIYNLLRLCSFLLSFFEFFPGLPRSSKNLPFYLRKRFCHFPFWICLLPF